MTKNYSTDPNNFTNYSNEEFDDVYSRALASTDDAEKTELYKEAQMILAEDAASVYIQDPANLVAVSDKLGGYVFYPISAQDMSVVYYEQ